jgi:hypothetical protein
MSERQPSRDLQWRCQDCTTPTGGPGAWLFVGFADIHRYEDAIAERARRRSSDPAPPAIADIIPIPLARWRVLCPACSDVEIDGGLHYNIELSRIATEADALLWTGHLASKHWLAWTDWLYTILEAAGLDRASVAAAGEP